MKHATNEKNQSLRIYVLIFAFLTLVSYLSAQSSSSYKIEWNTIDAGGSEGDLMRSTNYKSTAAVGQSTPIDVSWLHSTHKLVHPGFRKIDLDWRPPLTQFFGDIVTYDTISADSILLFWIGNDTTPEEGFGWGMWVYDLQYRPGTTSTWISLLTESPDTSYMFRGMTDGMWYYFRVRGHDLATNVPDWDTSLVAIDSVYCQLILYTLVVETSFPDGIIIVDGASYTSPFIEYFSGTITHTIAVYETVVVGDSVRYIFKQWEDGDTSLLRTVTILGDSTLTAIYKPQYRLIIANPSGYDTPSPDTGHYWIDSAGTVLATMTTSPVTVAAGSLAYCIGFYGTGSAPDSGFGTSAYFTISSPSNITWRWITVPEGTPECTLYVYSQYGHPMPSDTTVYPCGTHIVATVEESILVGGLWHHCTGWLGGGAVPDSGTTNTVAFTLTATSWIVWQWDSLWLLPLVVENDGITPSDTDGYDTPSPPPGFYWVPKDTIVNASIHTMDAAAFMRYIGYWASGSIFPPAGIDSLLSFRMTQPTWLHWLWAPAGTTIVCLAVFSEYDAPNPPVGVTCYPYGTTINASVAPMTTDSHYCTGYWGSGSVPTDTTGTDPTPWEVSFSLTENSQLVWVWDSLVRFPLVVRNEGVSPTDTDGYDTPIPTVGIHWYDSGDTIFAHINRYDSAASMQCIGFWGSGSAPGASSDTAVEFTIRLPSFISWRWAPLGTTIVCLTVYSEYGTPTPPRGTSCYPIYTTITATVDESVYVSAIGDWVNVRGYRGSGSVPDSGFGNSVTFTIDTSSWIVWQWDTTLRWPFVVVSAHDAPIPPVGTNWFNDGDTIYGHVWLTDGAWACIGYNGFGDLDSSFTHFFEFVIHSPSGVEWLWSTTAKRIIVQKNPLSDTLGFITINGVTFYNSSSETLYAEAGETLELSVSQIDYLPDSLNRFHFNMWLDSVYDTSRTYIVVTDTIFYANYVPQNLVIVRKIPSSNVFGTLTVDTTTYTDSASVYQELWLENGSIHMFTVSDYDTSATARYDFTQWDDSSTSPTRVIIVMGPDTLTAYYSASYLITIAKNPAEPYGCIYLPDTSICGASIASFWSDESTTVSFGVSWRDTVPGTDSMYTFSMWEDSTTDTMHSSILVVEPDTYVAYYIGSIYVICLQLDQYGSVGGADSLYWNPGTVSVNETRSMGPGSMGGRIKATNCGTVDLRLSLRVQGTYNASTGDTIPWSPGYSPGNNRFVLRANIRNTDWPPISYLPTNDYIPSTWRYATNSTDTPPSIFGPAGGRITPSGSVYMFMQFIAPTASSVYGVPIVIVVNVRAQIRLP